MSVFGIRGDLVARFLSRGVVLVIGTSAAMVAASSGRHGQKLRKCAFAAEFRMDPVSVVLASFHLFPTIRVKLATEGGHVAVAEGGDDVFIVVAVEPKRPTIVRPVHHIAAARTPLFNHAVELDGEMLGVCVHIVAVFLKVAAVHCNVVGYRQWRTYALGLD